MAAAGAQVGVKPRREAPSYIRREMNREPGNVWMEMALLGYCVFSGLTGLYFQSLPVMITLFGGGLLAWLGSILPSTFAKAKQRVQAEVDAKAKEAPAAAAAAAVQALLPSPQLVSTLIKARRSIFPKDLNGQKVPKEQIEAMLEAANWAPTHNLTQPWRFVVLEGASKLAFESLTVDCVAKYTQPVEASEAAVERMKGKATKTWPLVSHYVVVCMARPTGKGGKQNPEWEDVASVSCAVQNMHLLATSMGLGAYWSSWQAKARDAPEMAEFLGLDTARGDKCLGVFSLGMSDRIEGYRGSRGPAMDKVIWRS